MVLGRTHSGFQAPSEPSMVPVLRKTSRNPYVWCSRGRDPLTAPAGPRSPGAAVSLRPSPPGPASALGQPVRSPAEPTGPGPKSFPYTRGWRGKMPVQTGHLVRPGRSLPRRACQGPGVGWRHSPREPSTAAPRPPRGAPVGKGSGRFEGSLLPTAGIKGTWPRPQGALGTGVFV